MQIDVPHLESPCDDVRPIIIIYVNFAIRAKQKCKVCFAFIHKNSNEKISGTTILQLADDNVNREFFNELILVY